VPAVPCATAASSLTTLKISAMVPSAKRLVTRIIILSTGFDFATSESACAGADND
jgi:hypothetical protein